MRKVIAAAAAVIVGAVIVVILKNCIIVSEPHIPGGSTVQEHPAEQQEEEQRESSVSVSLGEEALLQLIPEMFSALGDIQQIEITFPKQNTMHISGVLPTQGIQDMLQKSDSIIAQSESFLLQQAQKQTVSVEATVICDATQFFVSDLTVDGLAISPELCDSKLSEAFHAAFAREAQKRLAEIYTIAIEQDGIHITGAEK